HGHARGHALTAAEQPQVELVPDGEHEDHDPEVGQRAQRRPYLDREQRRRDLPLEQGRPQQDAGDDLAEHWWLPEALGRHAEQPGEHDDDRQVGQEQLDFLICHREPLPMTKTTPWASAAAVGLMVGHPAGPLATGTTSERWPDFTIGHSNAMALAPTGRNL